MSSTGFNTTALQANNIPFEELTPAQHEFLREFQAKFQDYPWVVNNTFEVFSKWKNRHTYGSYTLLDFIGEAATNLQLRFEWLQRLTALIGGENCVIIRVDTSPSPQTSNSPAPPSAPICTIFVTFPDGTQFSSSNIYGRTPVTWRYATTCHAVVAAVAAEPTPQPADTNNWVVTQGFRTDMALDKRPHPSQNAPQNVEADAAAAAAASQQPHPALHPPPPPQKKKKKQQQQHRTVVLPVSEQPPQVGQTYTSRFRSNPKPEKPPRVAKTKQSTGYNATRSNAPSPEPFTAAALPCRETDLESEALAEMEVDADVGPLVAQPQPRHPNPHPLLSPFPPSTLNPYHSNLDSNSTPSTLVGAESVVLATPPPARVFFSSRTLPCPQTWSVRQGEASVMRKYVSVVNPSNDVNARFNAGATGAPSQLAENSSGGATPTHIECGREDDEEDVIPSYEPLAYPSSSPFSSSSLKLTASNFHTDVETCQIHGPSQVPLTTITAAAAADNVNAATADCHIRKPTLRPAEWHATTTPVVSQSLWSQGERAPHLQPERQPRPKMHVYGNFPQGNGFRRCYAPTSSSSSDSTSTSPESSAEEDAGACGGSLKGKHRAQDGGDHDYEPAPRPSKRQRARMASQSKDRCSSGPQAEAEGVIPPPLTVQHHDSEMSFEENVEALRDCCRKIDDESILKQYDSILWTLEKSKTNELPNGDELACIEDVAYLLKDYPDEMRANARIFSAAYTVECGRGWVQVRTPAGELFETTENGKERPWESCDTEPPVYRPQNPESASPNK